MTKMMELTDKDFKTDFVNVLNLPKELNKNISTMMRYMKDTK